MSAILNNESDLNKIQAYIVQMKQDRGFTDNTDRAVINLTRQVGSLAAAIKATWDANELLSDARSAIAQEIADIIIFTLDIANQHNISVATALADRETVNSKRQWTVSNRA